MLEEGRGIALSLFYSVFCVVTLKLSISFTLV